MMRLQVYIRSHHKFGLLRLNDIVEESSVQVLIFRVQITDQTFRSEVPLALALVITLLGQ